MVRPHQRERVKTPSERPAAARPAPLKLVASQRIDTDAIAEPAKPAVTIAPRRVTLSKPAKQPVHGADEFGSFPEFAEAKGADTLPELLEAAAAYLSYVEGHEEFSRPQLMNKARQVEELSFSREDGLRSFGQLLRDGKIEKLQGGRFTASELIGFRPKNRAAG